MIRRVAAERLVTVALVTTVALVATAQPSAPARGQDVPERIAPPDPMPARLLRTLAHNPRGYQPGRRESAGSVLLGDLLFHSPALLGPEARRRDVSCQTCHPNGAAHTTIDLGEASDRPGNVDLSSRVFHAAADDAIDDAVNVPSLRGARYTAPYGRDGRFASLPELLRTVIVDEFGGAEPTPAQLAALARYVRELDFLPNRLLDRHDRLTELASPEARRGEELFRRARPGFDGQSCASCHVPSSFFRDGRAHRHGGGDRASPYSLDDGFETPTLLGTAETAPYFHDGALATLADVVAWYDATFDLRLSRRDAAALTAYLAAIGHVDEPHDRRALGQRLVARFAYLNLLTDGPYRDDRSIWQLALDAVGAALRTPPRPAAVVARIEAAERRLLDLKRRIADGEPPAHLRPGVERLHDRLRRLAADWTGTRAPPTTH